MAYSAAVEKWRPLVSKYFQPQDIEKALHVISGESGGNPGAVGDNGASHGLFQLNNDGLGSGVPVQQRLDPETNIRIAASAVYGGSGWKPWGEGSLYQGKPFGALGREPFAQEGNNVNPEPPGSFMDAPDPATILSNPNPTVDEQAGLADMIVQEVLRQRPDPNDPKYKETGPDGYPLADYMLDSQDWLAAVSEATDAAARLKEFTQGRVTMPDGTVRLLGTATPEERALFEEANQQIYRSMLNSYGLDQYAAETQRVQTDFSNKLAALDASLAVDDARLDQATKTIDRQLSGQQESRQRAQLAADTKLKAAPYATSPGKSSFSAADFGGSLMALAGNAGLDGNQSLLNYPTTLTLDPTGDMSRFDTQAGVSGPLAGIPSLLTGAAPGAPTLPGAPRLSGPGAPPSLMQLGGQAGAAPAAGSGDIGASLLELAIQAQGNGAGNSGQPFTPKDPWAGAAGAGPAATGGGGGNEWLMKLLQGLGTGIQTAARPPGMNIANYLSDRIR